MRSVVAAVCLAATAAPALAFAPASCGVSYGQRAAQASCLAHRANGVMGLRAADGDRFERGDLTPDRKINLGTTQTSWQGWGSANTQTEKPKIVVDSKNPEEAVKEALLRAREFDGIAKFLGTSESKNKAGITGDVEFVSLKGSELVLRLTGNFWHNRQMVFDSTTKFIKQALPMGTVATVTIEDLSQLEGFAETSNAFKNVAKVTEDDLRNNEAKGMNMYGEKLEGPAAQFRRDKIANQAKYDSMMAKEREMSKKDDSAQITEIIENEGLAAMFAGKGPAPSKATPEDNMRPEDILKALM